MSQTVVVTGIGWVTALGTDVDDVWRRLLAGRTGIAPVRSFDTSEYDVHLGGEIPIDGLPHPGSAPAGGRSSRLAVAAARAAVDDAGLDLSTLDPARIGVTMGTTSGEPIEVERFNDVRLRDEVEIVGPELATVYPCHTIPAAVGSDLGLRGPNTMIPTACAAGSYAAAQGLETLRRGRADVMLAGGADAFSRITYAGFARLGAIAPERVQPFDRDRRGMIPGEGAAVLVLETEAKARERGASIYAELAGYGLSCDAHHMTGAHPEGDGAVRAMRTALGHAGIDSDTVDYVSAHGTGTPTNDRIEAAAVRAVFGERSAHVPVSSVKSMLGHTMGAASAIESAVCCLAIRDGRVPPTINFEAADPDCPIDCVPNEARELRIDVAMNNAYAFGGNNASLVFRRQAVCS